MKKVAIITLNYNGKEDTLELLESLKRLQAFGSEAQARRVTGYRLQIIMVDNASSDGAVKEIQKQFPQVTIIQNGINKGFSGGFNRGIEYAQVWGADYFLLVNNDSLIKDENLIQELIKTAEKEDKIGLVSPKIYFAPGFE